MSVAKPTRASIRRWGVTAGVVVGTLAITALLIVSAGADPLTGLQGLVQGVSSSPYRVGELLVGAVPTAIVALTLIPALRAGIFSVGAEGQIVLGAIFATGAILFLKTVLGEGAPSILFWIAGAVAGMLGGALAAAIPAFLAARWRVNEILSTLLLNYVFAGFLSWSLRTWLATPEQSATPQSEKLPEAATLPTLIPQTRAHVAVLLVVVLVVVFILWRRSAAATRIGVFATRPKLALRLGATRSGTIWSTMLVSGLGAGLVGWIQVAGVNDRLFTSVSGGVGFSGIAVGLLGGLLPVGIAVAAVFFSALTVGAVGMQSATSGAVPSSIADVIKGVLLLAVACIAAVQRTAIVPPSDPAPVAADDDTAELASASVSATASASGSASDDDTAGAPR